MSMNECLSNVKSQNKQGMTSHNLFWTRLGTKLWQITVILKDS